MKTPVHSRVSRAGVLLAAIGLATAGASAQTAAPAPQPQAASAPATAASAPPSIPAGVVPPADYIIGPEDVLSIVFWREKDMSSDVTVRPDGNISLVLINDLPAAGLTPEQLRVAITDAAGKFVADPTVTVVVKQINSRKVFITGQVSKPGPYPLGAPTTVLQMIANAGGVAEYADEENILVVRSENGKETPIRVNFKDIKKGKNLQQNVQLKPGDTIIVP